MRYVSCLCMEYGISFLPDCLKPCAPGAEIKFLENYNGELIEPEFYYELREKYRKMFKAGVIPNQCTTCGCLEEKDWIENSPIKYVGINHRSKCSCNCVYCAMSDNKEYYNSLKSYDILPVLQGLADKNVLQGTTLDIAGGECCEYENNELEKIVEFAIKYNLWIHFFSSGIFYSKSIEEMLSITKANIYISVDSGTSETYNKIKRVDCHNKVWENIARYSAAANIHKACTKGYVILKYILIPGINDTKEEVNAFFDKCKQVSCKYVQVSIERGWFSSNKDNIPKSLVEITELFDEQSNNFIIEYVEDAPKIKKYYKHPD